jgi:hypothetical protein
LRLPGEPSLYLLFYPSNEFLYLPASDVTGRSRHLRSAGWRINWPTKQERRARHCLGEAIPRDAHAPRTVCVCQPVWLPRSRLASHRSLPSSSRSRLPSCWCAGSGALVMAVRALFIGPTKPMKRRRDRSDRCDWLKCGALVLFYDPTKRRISSPAFIPAGLFLISSIILLVVAVRRRRA